jgi:hypothetical protein
MMTKNSIKQLSIFLIFFSTFLIACGDDDESVSPSSTSTVNDPATASEVSIDRFSSDAGTLMVRDSDNGLPEANSPINFDSGAPFITKGLGPDGQLVEYYNFDVMPTTPAPIFVLFKEGETSTVEDQLNIINVIPGDANYNDFWNVTKVTVPDDYVANTISSYDEILSSGYEISNTTMIVNCPVVPNGSTASKRTNSTEDAGLVKGWYNKMLVYYFTFSEKEIATDSEGMVPTSPIYVTFNINPGETDGGPASGFVTESGSDQTHNVLATIPSNGAYSPLWLVKIYDNSDFSSVSDFNSASSANILEPMATNVNCPVVSIN